jgi:hypothetical protein
MKVLQILLSPVFWLLRKLAKWTLILAIVLIVVLASGNIWLPYVVRWQVHSKTGFRAHIDSSCGSLFRGHLDFRDFDILNPKNKFNNNAFVSFNELTADVNLRSLLTGTVVLDKIVIDIDNITLIKNADGVYNCQHFVKNISRPTPAKTAPVKNKSNSRGKNVPAGGNAKKMCLKKVAFTLKSVKIIDESGAEPAKEYSLNYRRKFTNIEDANAIIKPLMADLSKYGVSLFVQSVFDSVLHMPGVDQVTDGVMTIKDISKGTIRDIETGIKHLFKK